MAMPPDAKNRAQSDVRPASPAEPDTGVRAAIAARLLAKKIAETSPRPPAGRRAQEVDAEPIERESGRRASQRAPSTVTSSM